jgi:hypothetical protein
MMAPDSHRVMPVLGSSMAGTRRLMFDLLEGWLLQVAHVWYCFVSNNCE